MTLPERLRLRPPNGRLSDREWIWLWSEHMHYLDSIDAVVAMRAARGLRAVPWRQA